MICLKLKRECDQLFTQIDRRLLTIPGQDPFNPLLVLGYNLHLLKDYTDEILSFACEYDADGVPATNGFWSWVRIVINFARHVLQSFTTKGIAKTLQDQHLIRVSLILTYVLDLIIKIRVDLIARSSKENNNNERKDAAPILFSPYESCFSEAILLYNQTMEDNELTENDRIRIWKTLTSLMTTNYEASNSSPVMEMASVSSSLIRDKMFSTLSIPYIPYLTNRSSQVLETRVLVQGCDWVVNAGHKRQVYKREDYNKTVHVMNHYESICCKDNGKKNTIILFLRDSWDECCRNLARDIRIPCLDVFSDQNQDHHRNFNLSLQQLLDTYVWIYSRNAKKVIGFKPRLVILVGYGDAGLLALSLCVLINEINRMRRGIIQLPQTIITVRSKFNSKLSLSPASVLTFVTCMNGQLVTCLENRMNICETTPKKTTETIKSRRRSVRSQSVALPSSLPQVVSKFSRLIQLTNIWDGIYTSPVNFLFSIPSNCLQQGISTIHTLNLEVNRLLHSVVTTPLLILKDSLWDNNREQDQDLKVLSMPKHPEIHEAKNKITIAGIPEDYEEMLYYECPNRVREWDRDNRRQISNSSDCMQFFETIKKYNETANSSLMSPLLYDKISDLKSVRLHLLTSHFDAALDDSIALSKTYEGFSRIHLLQEEPVDQLFEQMQAGKILSKAKSYKMIVEIIENECNIEE